MTEPCFPLLVLGHPRSGSRSLAAALSARGVLVGHERPERDGMVSWWHAGRALGSRRFDNGAKAPPAFTAGVVAHYLRDPREAIPSIVLENEHLGRDNNSFRFRARILRRACGVDIDALPPLAAAAASYALWNDLAASLSDFERPILVETPDLGPLFERMGRALPAGTAEGPVRMPRLNDSKGKFGVDKERRPTAEILAAVPDEIARRLEPYFDLYGA